MAAIIEPVARGRGLELVEAHFVTEHGRKVLRVYIDKPGGVTVGDCGSLSRELGTIFDVEDAVSGKYMLEVSSPGLDRPLIKPAHFEAAIGKKVKLKVYDAIDERRNFIGHIKAVSGDSVEIEDSEGQSFCIDIGNIDRARLEIEI